MDVGGIGSMSWTISIGMMYIKLLEHGQCNHLERSKMERKMVLEEMFSLREPMFFG